MQELLGSDISTILFWILAIGLGWIVLRFLLKLASKIFAIGCFAIIVIGLILLAMQYFQGV